MKQCKWKDCPVRYGFEVYYCGEEDEKWARKKILPLIKKLFNIGKPLQQYAIKVNEDRELKKGEKCGNI